MNVVSLCFVLCSAFNFYVIQQLCDFSCCFSAVSESGAFCLPILLTDVCIYVLLCVLFCYIIFFVAVLRVSGLENRD
jgi:hypothetical protein